MVVWSPTLLLSAPASDPIADMYERRALEREARKLILKNAQNTVHEVEAFIAQQQELIKALEVLKEAFKEPTVSATV